MTQLARQTIVPLNQISTLPHLKRGQWANSRRSRKKWLTAAFGVIRREAPWLNAFRRTPIDSIPLHLSWSWVNTNASCTRTAGQFQGSRVQNDGISSFSKKKGSSYISSRKATWFPYFLAAVTTCSRNNLKSQASRHDTTPLSSRFIRTSFTTTLGRGGGGIETKCILKLSDKIALRKSPFLLSVVLFSR